jgi:hypothetical protein
LKNWLETTNEQTIANGENKTGNEKWIFLNLNGKKYYINADTTREGIDAFVNNHDENYSWKVIANNRKVYIKVSNDLNGNTIKGLYFYSDIIGEREM